MQLTRSVLTICLFLLVLFNTHSLARGHRLPRALLFDVAQVTSPNDDGSFIVSCRLVSLLAHTKVALIIDCGNEFEILRGAKKLKGRLRLGKASELRLRLKKSSQEDGEAVLRFALRYKYPYKAAVAKVEDDPFVRYPTVSHKREAINQLRQIAKSGRRVFTINRAIVVD